MHLGEKTKLHGDKTMPFGEETSLLGEKTKSFGDETMFLGEVSEFDFCATGAIAATPTGVTRSSRGVADPR